MLVAFKIAHVKLITCVNALETGNTLWCDLNLIKHHCAFGTE